MSHKIISMLKSRGRVVPLLHERMKNQQTHFCISYVSKDVFNKLLKSLVKKSSSKYMYYSKQSA